LSDRGFWLKKNALHTSERVELCELRVKRAKKSGFDGSESLETLQAQLKELKAQLAGYKQEQAQRAKKKA
jgi:hypothetical protein